MKPFMKHDGEKARVDLLPFGALEEVGRVLAYGAQKYAPHNWAKCPTWGRYFGASLRHLFAWGRGEDRDPESGLGHLAHAACCVLFLMDMQRRGLGSDDRALEQARTPAPFVAHEGSPVMAGEPPPTADLVRRAYEQGLANGRGESRCCRTCDDESSGLCETCMDLSSTREACDMRRARDEAEASARRFINDGLRLAKERDEARQWHQDARDAERRLEGVLEETQSHLRASRAMTCDLAADVGSARRERDEARAQLAAERAACERCRQEPEEASARAALEKVREERDEARNTAAELLVERDEAEESEGEARTGLSLALATLEQVREALAERHALPDMPEETLRLSYVIGRAEALLSASAPAEPHGEGHCMMGSSCERATGAKP